MKTMEPTCVRSLGWTAPRVRRGAVGLVVAMAMGCGAGQGAPDGTGVGSNNGGMSATGGRAGNGAGGGTSNGGSGPSGNGGAGGGGGSAGAGIGGSAGSSGGSAGSSGGSAGASGGSAGAGGAGGNARDGGTTSAPDARAAEAGRAMDAAGTLADATAPKTGPCDVWIAPNGVDTNPGTEALPVATIQHAYDLVCPGVKASQDGDLCSGTLSTMCLKAGTYPMSTRFEFKKTRMGTADRIITLMADPAAATRPLLDFSSQPRLSCGASPADKNQYGIDIGSDWTRVKGVEVANANDTGILVQGAHDFVELCDVHDSADTGIKISSSSGFTGSGTFNTILNCDSHHNNDPQCNGANADGFGAKEGGGDGNVFDGCRSWDNADDGWDLFAWTSPVTVRNSWAFNMGATTSGSMSNGNGFKMGGNKVSAKHIMSNDFAFDNNETAGGAHVSDWGFTNNSNPASMTCTGCGANNNRGGSFQNITSSGGVSITNATTAKASAAKRNADGSLPDITKL